MKYIEIDKNGINKLTEKILTKKTAESTAHPFIDNGKQKLFKLFKEGIDIDNKTKKIILLNDRLKDVDFVITAESIVKYNGKVIGYIMPYINGQVFNSLSFRKKDNILVLKDISQKLKELHKLGIVCGDILHNILVDSNKNVYFIDHDNFSIDGLPIDTKNFFLQEYEKQIKTFDYKFDNYLLNILTLSIITKVQAYYINLYYNKNCENFNFRDDEINKIVRNTLNLNVPYEEDLIVDKIETKKDFKKIKTRFF